MRLRMITLVVVGMLVMAGCGRGSPQPGPLPEAPIRQTQGDPHPNPALRAFGVPEGALRQAQEPGVISFTPYASSTARPTASATAPGTATPLPSPSPTPRQHSVARGEDMGGIAFRYGITLEALMAANPNVSPNSMSVGTVLLIPGSDRPAAGEPTSVPSLTPVPLTVGPVQCAVTREGGAWCFLPVRNTTDAALENLSAVLRIADSASGQILSQIGLPPLDRLPPGAEMPLAAYFPAPVPANFTAGGTLLTAMPVAGGNRYVEAQVVDPQIAIASGGLSAQVRGAVTLVEGQPGAGQVWVAAVAYDGAGRVAGMRRWEAGEALEPGGQVDFDFAVYSTGAVIERVEVLVQARP